MYELSQFYVRLHNHIRFGRNDEAITMLNQEPAQSSTDLGTLLHHAATCKNVAIARELVRLGVKVDRVRLAGRTALVTAVRRSHPPTVKVLLEAGASIDALDAAGRNALQTAFSIQDPEILRLFIRRVRDEAASNGDYSIEKMVNAGCTLRHAASADDFELMKSLVDRGADVNSLDARDAMFLAACYGHLSIIRLFLKNGADPDREVTHGGFTALHILIARSMPYFTRASAADTIDRYNECAILLLQNGATFPNSNELYQPQLNHFMLEIHDKMRNIVIAHLAMIGTVDTSYTQWIKRRAEYATQLDLCQRTLAISFTEKLSLIDLLTADEFKMAKLVRKNTFTAEIEEFCSEHKLSELCFYYYSTLMRNVDEATRRVKLEDEATSVICVIFNGNYSQCYIAARMIVEYLRTSDLKQLGQV